jgi:hypothetical protein
VIGGEETSEEDALGAYLGEDEGAEGEQLEHALWDSVVD